MTIAKPANAEKIRKSGESVPMYRKIISRMTKFIYIEAASGIVLLVSTITAIALANSGLDGPYRSLLDHSLAGLSLRHWINDGLMTIFFFLVGIEIKRELIKGELSTRAKAALPIVAAFGGMLIPAVIYGSFNIGTSASSGWGVPMATDIAFSLGVVVLLGKRISPPLKTFLLALAIVDDIGAVVVIALFYTREIVWTPLIGGLSLLIGLLFFNWKGGQKAAIFLLVGILIWLCFLRSGVHATIAGVLLAATIPLNTGRYLERVLHPWVAFLIMPLFALANAGVAFTGSELSYRVSLGIIFGLVFGKQIGITFFSWLAVKFRIAALPRQTSWAQIYGIGCLGGIGFTMSIFIANLAFKESTLIDSAKIAILSASALSACLGTVVFMRRKSLN